MEEISAKKHAEEIKSNNKALADFRASSIGDHPCGDQGASAYLASSTHTSMVLDMGIDQVNGNMDTNLR